MKKLITGVLLLILCYSCKKHQDDVGTSQNIYLRGRLLLYDTVSGAYSYAANQIYPLAKQVVYADYLSPASGPDHLFADSTDANGYFTFTSVKPGTKYVISSVDTGSTGMIYQALDTVSGSPPGIDTLLLIAEPSSANSGVIFYFTDPGYNGPIAGVNVCVFLNPTEPVAPDTSCQGSKYQLISNSLGRIPFLNTGPGYYYPQINASFPAFKYNALDTILVTGKVVIDTILLH